MTLSPVTLQLPPSVAMTDEQFFEFCQMNQSLRIERDRTGVISIMSPTGSETGNREVNILGQLWSWAEQDGSGLVFSSSAGFKLSNGAERSPDAAWISLERWQGLTLEQQQRFAPICPDFVVELRSPSDSLKPLQDKMVEYLAEPGCRLGWLIDRHQRRVFVYRSQRDVECLQSPSQICAEPELSGFMLNLTKVW